MNFIKSFLTRFSKGIGAAGGVGLGALIALGANALGHPINSTAATAIGGIVLTVLAPPNSLTTP